MPFGFSPAPPCLKGGAGTFFIALLHLYNVPIYVRFCHVRETVLVDGRLRRPFRVGAFLRASAIASWRSLNYFAVARHFIAIFSHISWRSLNYFAVSRHLRDIKEYTRRGSPAGYILVAVACIISI